MLLLPAAVSESSLLRETAGKAVPQAVKAYEAMDFSMALKAVLTISGTANQYLAEKAPWTLLKKASPSFTSMYRAMHMNFSCRTQKEIVPQFQGLL